MITRKRVIFFYFVFNALLTFIFIFYWFRPLADEFFYLRARIQIQEKKLTVKENNFMQYEENVNTLVELEQNETLQRVIPYRQLTEALSDISAAAKTHDLTERHFKAAEPLVYEGFYHIAITAQYDGSYDGICRFIETVSGTVYNIDRFSITNYSAEGTLWAWLSLYVTEN